jgi:hypothetical protein
VDSGLKSEVSETLRKYMQYTKVDNTMPHSWQYSPKNIRIEADEDLKYITNTKTTNIQNPEKETYDPIGKQVLAPKSRTAAGITSKMNRVIKFNLNMDSGDNYNTKITQYFDRLYSIYPRHELDTLCQYVFIVRPNLNILNKNGKLVNYGDNRAQYLPNSSPKKDQFFIHMKKTYPHILKNLTGNELSGHDFIPYLVGRTESLNVPDYTIKDYKVTQPFTGYNLPYASHALESQTGGQFEITFREDENLQIHKLFQTWLYYIDGVTRNRFGPLVKYIRNDQIDYACSVYCITCKADAEEIVYWTKYTGCFPTSVPNSDFSFNLRGTPNNKVSIPFDYFYQEALNPYILVDFNKNAHITTEAKYKKQGYIPIYRSDTLADIGMKESRSAERKAMTEPFNGLGTSFVKSAPISLGSGNGLVGAPFICKVGHKYYLRWKTTPNLAPCQ